MKFSPIVEPYSPGGAGKCPHCQLGVCFVEPNKVMVKTPNINQSYCLSTSLETMSGGESITVYSSKCPNCQKPIVVIKTKTELGLESTVSILKGIQIENQREPTYRIVYPFEFVKR